MYKLLKDTPFMEEPQIVPISHRLSTVSLCFWKCISSYGQSSIRIRCPDTTDNCYSSCLRRLTSMATNFYPIGNSREMSRLLLPRLEKFKSYSTGLSFKNNNNQNFFSCFKNEIIDDDGGITTCANRRRKRLLYWKQHGLCDRYDRRI